MSVENTNIAPPVLEVRGLSHTFILGPKMAWRSRKQQLQAVKNVSLTLQRGETLAIVGESGSGKSTLARCLVGIYQPTEGELYLAGERYDQSALRRRPELRRRIQMVFQDPSSSLNPRHRVGRILAEPLRALGGIRSRTELAARCAELLTSVGISPESAERYPHEFSGGQRQRIAIARALSLNPDVVICDEAVSALDVSVQGQVLNLLRRLQRDYDVSYIFITHDMAIVRHIADWVAVMYRGKIVEMGDVEQVFSDPQEEYTRKLLSAVPRGLRLVRTNR